MATKKDETKDKKPAAKKAAPKKAVAKKADEIEKLEAAEEVASASAKGGSFIPAVGRRKTSIARVRLIKNGKGLVTVNGRPMEDYFSTYELREIVTSPLKITGQENAVDVSAMAEGGGIRGQAEAVRHGLSRALLVLNPTFRKTLKKLGYLTRDSRKKERKKFGLKGARRAPQWSKR
jgi:small subunit ribosomal protein S9